MTRRQFLGSAAIATTLPTTPAHAEPNEAKEAPTSGTLSPGKLLNPVLAEEIDVTVGQRSFTALLQSPQADPPVSRPLLLINLGGSRDQSVSMHPYDMASKLFLSRGHRTLCFDLPDHGKRVTRYGEGIRGWRNAWIDGQDRFTQLVEEATAAIDLCIQRKVASAGRIVVYGISRGGYMAMRLLAANPNIAAAAAIAPVTDWRDLAEFAADRDRADIAALRLSQYTDSLAGKRLFTVIGNADQRVSTASCCRLFSSMVEANLRHGRDLSQLEFHCCAMGEPGHVVDDPWRRLGAEFLLKTA